MEPSIDYGSKFFLKTTEDLAAEKETFTGDDLMTDVITNELIETKFRNDSGGKTRANVLRDLDPLPGKNLDEVIKIKNAGGIDDLAFKIKVNFINYVMRFEREQLPIAQFMKDSDYNERIVLIKEKFKEYAGEFKQDRDDRSGERMVLSSEDGKEVGRSEGPDASEGEAENNGTGPG
jgi:hypothetical protein